MRYFTILLCLVFWSAAHADEQSDADIAALNQHGFELYYAGKYAEALPVAKQYAELIERRYGTAHSEYATALYYISEILRATNRLTEAEPLFRQALAIGEKSLGADNPKLAQAKTRAPFEKHLIKSNFYNHSKYLWYH
ncbi:MAG: tetratricopeptide repeat protein [Rhodomicrobium sp.]